MPKKSTPFFNLSIKRRRGGVGVAVLCRKGRGVGAVVGRGGGVVSQCTLLTLCRIDGGGVVMVLPLTCRADEVPVTPPPTYYQNTSFHLHIRLYQPNHFTNPKEQIRRFDHISHSIKPAS